MMTKINDNKQKNLNQIRPNLEETFKGSAVKEIISSVLSNILEDQIYSNDKIPEWISKIADDINTQVMNLNMKRYKHIVQTVVVQKGAGCRYISRCRWDSECDSQVTNYFTNESMVCIVTVFGVYLY
ncbi:Dynein light chain Tctex-type protein 2B [Pseudolycoriella hygida]|uniref:Dynein light chain Tctex-type protein 2B n=1 Tax=Pseudolycoriella hygida TaxID=35572 RepID=A0A9Q0RWW7_9DIPT|nr:Dynein light chain Tctex-type protein 2B [Pseudolycoriella hygida]